MLEKIILMEVRNCKIIWLIMTDKDTISMSDGHSFSTDTLSSIIKILSKPFFMVKQMASASVFSEYHTGVKPLH